MGDEPGRCAPAIGARRWRTGLPLGVLLLGVLLAAFGTPAGAGAGARPTVLVTTIDDTITPVIADHLADAVERAEDGGHQALVVTLDTPGGLDSSMRDIVQDFLAAEVPVVVMVGPRGARAASAGALITMAAHVAAMQPGTTIGAATPVDLQGGEVGDKIVNDAASYAEAIAEERGRNTEFAVDAVVDGRSVTASRAFELGVVDAVVDGRTALLEELDGREIELADGQIVAIDTVDAAVDEYDLSFFRSVLQWLADPNLAFLFLSVGTLALIYELASPGGGVAGVIGVAMIVLALFSLAVLPFEVVGLVFLAVAAGCFIAEVLAPGIGVFAFLGAGALVLGGLFLFDRDTPALTTSLQAVLPIAIVVGLAVVLAGRQAVRARRQQVAVGAEHLIGREAVVADGSTPLARLEGSWWRLRSPTTLDPGARVRVEAVEGIDLLVRPITDDERPTETPTGNGATDE